jgi:hypothetical protein
MILLLILSFSREQGYAKESIWMQKAEIWIPISSVTKIWKSICVFTYVMYVKN